MILTQYSYKNESYISSFYSCTIDIITCEKKLKINMHRTISSNVKKIMFLGIEFKYYY